METEERITVERPGQLTAEIIMMLDAAIGRLEGLGYDRKLDRISVHFGDPDALFPVSASLRGRPIFSVELERDNRGARIRGVWKREPKPLGRFRRWWRR